MASSNQPTTHRLRLRTGHSVHLEWAHVRGSAEGEGGGDHLRYEQPGQGQGRDQQWGQSSPRDGRCCVLVLVHGGPGLDESHRDLLAAFASPSGGSASLAESLRRAFPGGVILLGYDQLGCGESDGPDSASEYSLGAYVEELGDVLSWAASGEREWNSGMRDDPAGRRGAPLFVLGHSFGGQVVLELLMSGAAAAAGLLHGAVASNCPLDQGTYEQRQRAHREGLPGDLRGWMEREEEEQARGGSVGSLVYRTLVGLRECEVTGSMRGWSAMNRLPEGMCLTAVGGGPPLPCLLVVAGADPTESPAEAVMPCVRACPSIEVLVLEDADHFPFYGGSAGAFFASVASFLERHAADLSAAHARIADRS